MSQRATGTGRRESVNNALEEKSKHRVEKDRDKSTVQFDKDFDKFKNEIRGLFKSFEENIDKKLKKVEDKFSKVCDELKQEVNGLRGELVSTRAEVTEVRSKVNDLENSVSFQSERLEDIVDNQNSKVDKVKDELKEMKEKLVLLEKHERKYNLLFYGFQESQNEDLEDTMKHFFKDKLMLDQDRVDKMVFSNGHRIPSAARGPNPVIIRFVTYDDRDLVYSKFLSPVLKDERKRILTDLPLEMKIVRSALARAAYKIRMEEKMKTRIVEIGTSAHLEVRKTKTDAWERREI